MAAKRFECIALRADPSIRRSRDGRSVLGGAPLRLLRFSEAGAAAVDRVLSGAPVASGRADQVVAARLVDAGMAHPVPNGAPAVRLTAVIPVRNDAEALRTLLASDPLPAGTDIVVVDDGSDDPGVVATVALGVTAPGQARVVRHVLSGGPGAARNSGWAAADPESDVIVFLDADTVPQPGWLAEILGHLHDPLVGVVAPRVRTRAASGSVRDRYEAARSPLDLGPDEARVTPGGRVTYVPTAALACRRSVLEELGGFDEALRVGEDVDFVWRAVAAGWTVRYDPAATVLHAPRATWRAWLRQRMTYGSAAATLDLRHPGQVAPVRLNPWSLAAWGAACLGPSGMVIGAAATAVGAAALVPKLEGRVDEPAREAARLAGLGTLSVGAWLSRAVWRAWLPVALVGAVGSRRARRVVALSAIVPGLIDWRASDRDLDPIRFCAVHAADDAAYCAGVWLGAWRRRSLRCLLPAWTGIAGVTDRTASRGAGHTAVGDDESA